MKLVVTSTFIQINKNNTLFNLCLMPIITLLMGTWVTVRISSSFNVYVNIGHFIGRTYVKMKEEGSLLVIDLKPFIIRVHIKNMKICMYI